MTTNLITTFAAATDASLFDKQSLHGVLLPLGAILVITIVLRRGLLAPAVLESSPRRFLPFTAGDLIPIGLCWLFGQAAAACLRLVLHEDTQTLFIEQFAAHLTVIAYVTGVFLTRGGLPLAGMASRFQTFRFGVRQLGLIPSKPGRLLRVGGLGILVAVPTVWGLNQATVNIASLSTNPIGPGPATSPASLGLTGLVIGVLLLAPLFEEIVFRGFIQSCFRNVGPRWLGVTAAAAIFALLHATVAPASALPGLLVLGVILGWLYERTGSLWPGILTHAGFNAANMMLLLVATR